MEIEKGILKQNSIQPSPSLILVNKDGKYGYQDQNGRIQIKCIFNDASSFVNDLAWIRIGGKIAIIDKRGHYLTGMMNPKSFNGSNYKEIQRNLFKTLPHIWGPIIKNLNIRWSKNGWVMPSNKTLGREKLVISEFGYVSDSLLSFKIGRKWGIINDVGKIIVYPQYDLIGIVLEDTIFTNRENKDWVESFSEGLIKVKKGTKYGFINKQGEIIYPFIFNKVYENILGGIININGEKESFIFSLDHKCTVPLTFKGKSIYEISKEIELLNSISTKT